MNEDLDIPDDALAEIATLAPELTEQERRFIYWRSIGEPPGMAFQKAGYAGTGWRMVESRPRVREALLELNEKLEPEYRVTQKTVVGILMEAVSMARIKDQPKTMVEAARELAAVTGVGAATRVEVKQDISHRVAAREELQALRHLPRGMLEEVVGIQRILPPVMIEKLANIEDAEYEQID